MDTLTDVSILRVIVFLRARCCSDFVQTGLILFMLTFGDTAAAIFANRIGMYTRSLRKERAIGLNSIASLNSEAPDQAQVLLIQFGNYLRASFHAHSRDRFIPFAKEWALVQSYLYIEQVRFSDRLSVELDVADGMQFELPPLTLQPIVENAIRHGIMKRREGGTVRIAVRLTGEEAIITVADNGVGMRREMIGAVLESRAREGIGLVNTHKRLSYWYGRGLCIRSEPGQGTEITIRIPARSGNAQNGMARMMEAGGDHSGIM